MGLPTISLLLLQTEAFLRNAFTFFAWEPYFVSDGGSNEQERVSLASHALLSPKLHGPLNNSKKAKLLCVIKPQMGAGSSVSFSPYKFTTTKHSKSPWQKGQRLTDQCWPKQPGGSSSATQELQEALRSVKTCSVCPDPAPALSLEAAQRSNRTAQLYPKYNRPGHKQRLQKRAVGCAESRQLTSSLKKAASLCCSE